MKRLCLSLTLAVVVILLIAVPVLAAYYVYIIVENTGPDYDQLALNFTFDVDYLVSEGFINPSGLDTRVTDASYAVLPHMMADDKIMWVSDLEGDKATQFIFWMQQSDLDSMPVIAGNGGYVSIPDDDALEPSDVYAFGIMGYVNMAAGSDKNIIRKDDALLLSVTNDEELTFAVDGGNSLVATSVESGVHAIMIYCDGSEMWMDIDDIERDRVGASVASNTTYDWYLFENDVMPYVYYYGEWKV
jgi:hypothetical protein